MPQSPHSDQLTHGIRVHAHAEYIPEQSDPDNSMYFFAYTITVSNEGDAPAKLLDRHWVILDANNTREDVRGAGVIGKQPRIAPGKSFQYMSGCPLRTRWGTMEGSYTMERDDGTKFEASIGRFFLVSDEAKERARK